MPNLNYFHSAILALWTPLSNVAGDSFLNKEMLGGGTSASGLSDPCGHQVTPMGCRQLIPSTHRGHVPKCALGVHKVSREGDLTSALTCHGCPHIEGVGSELLCPWPRLLPQS